MTLFNKGMQTFFRTPGLGKGIPITGTSQCRTVWNQLQIQHGECAFVTRGETGLSSKPSLGHCDYKIGTNK